MKFFLLKLLFTDDKENPLGTVVTRDQDFQEIIENKEALLNAVRDIYIGLLEEILKQETRAAILKDQATLIERAKLLEKKRVLLCPESFLPNEKEKIQ